MTLPDATKPSRGQSERFDHHFFLTGRRQRCNLLDRLTLYRCQLMLYSRVRAANCARNSLPAMV